MMCIEANDGRARLKCRARCGGLRSEGVVRILERKGPGNQEEDDENGCVATTEGGVTGGM